MIYAVLYVWYISLVSIKRRGRKRHHDDLVFSDITLSNVPPVVDDHHDDLVFSDITLSDVPPVVADISNVPPPISYLFLETDGREVGGASGVILVKNT